jgi:hypothetical protein
MLIHTFTRIEGDGQSDGGNLRTLETEVLRMVEWWELCVSNPYIQRFLLHIHHIYGLWPEDSRSRVRLARRTATIALLAFSPSRQTCLHPRHTAYRHLRSAWEKKYYHCGTGAVVSKISIALGCRGVY